MSTTDTITIRGLTPRLKGRIARRVAETGTNMNDLLVKILADRFAVPFEGKGDRRRKTIGTSDQVLLELPADLKQAIRLDAAANGETIRNVAVRLISDELGVPFVATGRWETAKPPRNRRRPTARA